MLEVGPKLEMPTTPRSGAAPGARSPWPDSLPRVQEHDKSTPFFMYLALHNVHQPVSDPKKQHHATRALSTTPLALVV